MSVSYKFKIEPDVGPLLEGMRSGMKRAVLKKSMRAGCKILRQRIKSSINKGVSGALRSSISTKIKQSNNVVYGVTGARTAYQKGKQRPAFYAHLYETGRQQDKIKNKKVLFGYGKFWGKSVSGFTGRHPLLSAYSSLKQTLMNTILDSIRQQIAAMLTR